MDEVTSDTTDLKPLEDDISLEEVQEEYSSHDDISDNDENNEKSENTEKKARSPRGAYDSIILKIISKSRFPLKDKEIHEILKDKHNITIQLTQVSNIRRRLEKKNKTVEPTQKVQPVESVDPFSTFENLPYREKQGRKELRNCKKLSITLDDNLYEIILRESKKRYWPEAVTLEWVLWNSLGRPTLTYSPSQQPEESVAQVAEPIRVESKPKRKPGRKAKQVR